MNDTKSDLGAKIALRKHFLELTPSPKILECSTGEGRKIFHACYEGLDCTSLDMKPVKGAIRANNRTFIASQDMTPYNFFDLDGYASPYENLLNILHRKAGRTEPFTIVCTDTTGKRPLGIVKGSSLILAVINNKRKIDIPFINRHQEFIIKLILKEFTLKYGFTATARKIVRIPEENSFYFGVRLVGTLSVRPKTRTLADEIETIA